MSSGLIVTIAVLMGLAAILYSMVGHGGASAYLAIMAIFAVAPDVIRPTALALNLVAAGIASIRYASAEQVNWRLLAFFVVAAAPAAFLGGKPADHPARLGRAAPDIRDRRGFHPYQ